MIHEVLAVGPLRCNCSVLGDEISGDALVVDPGDDIERILTILARHNLTVKQILVTHAHFDHIAGAGQLKRLTGAPIFYNQHDLPLLSMMEEQAAWLGMRPQDVTAPDDDLPEGCIIEIGSAPTTPAAVTPKLSGQILHTPGHTEGSVCLYMAEQNLLLAGDTLFAGSVGRTDLPGGDGRALIRSIHNKLLVLPEDTIVVPGHGPRTTIGAEKTTNPFLT